MLDRVFHQPFELPPEESGVQAGVDRRESGGMGFCPIVPFFEVWEGGSERRGAEVKRRRGFRRGGGAKCGWAEDGGEGRTCEAGLHRLLSDGLSCRPIAFVIASPWAGPRPFTLFPLTTIYYCQILVLYGLIILSFHPTYANNLSNQSFSFFPFYFF